MKVGDVFSYAFSAIRLRKLRAGLTTLGVVIGIAAIVALLSISQGLQVTITDQLQSGFVTDALIVSTGGGTQFIAQDSGAGGRRVALAPLQTDEPTLLRELGERLEVQCTIMD